MPAKAEYQPQTALRALLCAGRWTPCSSQSHTGSSWTLWKHGLWKMRLSLTKHSTHTPVVWLPSEGFFSLIWRVTWWKDTAVTLYWTLASFLSCGHDILKCKGQKKESTGVERDHAFISYAYYPSTHVCATSLPHTLFYFVLHVHGDLFVVGYSLLLFSFILQKNIWQPYSQLVSLLVAAAPTCSHSNHVDIEEYLILLIYNNILITFNKAELHIVFENILGELYI